MPEKGTLCHAATRSEMCEGVSRLHGMILVGQGVGGVGGKGESSWCVFEWKYCFPV